MGFIVEKDADFRLFFLGTLFVLSAVVVHGFAFAGAVMGRR
ncbi:MAG: hypothetical protein ACYTHN_00700 [Planctomycetota bacterium]